MDSKLVAQAKVKGVAVPPEKETTVNIGYAPGAGSSSPSTYFTGSLKQLRYYRSTYYEQLALKGELRQSFVFFN